MVSKTTTDAGRIGPYSVVGRIAIGGMSEIFEAHRSDDSKSDHASVVIKKMLPEYARDPDLVQAFSHEAELAERLTHPCLVKVLEHGVDQAEPYIVMEHVRGISLAELLQYLRTTDRKLDWKIAVFITSAVLEALAYVHEARDEAGTKLNVVHRDVTPQNVLLSQDGSVKLGDFGIARSSLRAARTRTGMIKGKLLYLAPEQVTHSDIGARTDLYSVGVMLFELLTNETYYTGKTELEIIRAAEEPMLRKPSDVVSHMDPVLDRVVEKAVKRFPEERWQSADGMNAALSEFAAPSPDQKVCSNVLANWVRNARAAGYGPHSIAAPIVAKRVPRRRRLVAIGSAIMLCVGGIVFLLGTEASSTTANQEAPRAKERAAKAFSEPPASDDAAIRVDENIMEIVSEKAKDRPMERRQRVLAVETNEPDADVLQREVAMVMAELQKRRLRKSDLSVEARNALKKSGQFEIVRKELEGIKIDAYFVRGKLRRTNLAIQDARARGLRTDRLEALSAAALQDLMAGRYEATNERLESILDVIETARAQ